MRRARSFRSSNGSTGSQPRREGSAARGRGLRRAGWAASLVAVLGFLAPAPAHAWDRGRRGPYGHRPYVRSRVFIGVGPAYYWGAPYPGWWYGPRPWYDDPPPRVILEEPPVYIERDRSARAAEGWWYYCESERGYYPDVAACPEPWIEVPPRPAP